MLLEQNENGLELGAKARKAQQAVGAIKKIKKEYGIAISTFYPGQMKVVEAVQMRVSSGLPQYKGIAMFGGNGAGKSYTGAKIVALKALGDLIHEINNAGISKNKLPYLGSAKRILIGTTTTDTLESVLFQYLLGDGSAARIPPKYVKRFSKKEKTIELINGTVIFGKTFEAGIHGWKGHNADFIWIDEEPRDEDVFNEIIGRTRGKKTQVLFTMTAQHGETELIRFFKKQKDKALSKRLFTTTVTALENGTIDISAFKGLSEAEQRMRIYGEVVQPTGLVYNEFLHSENVVPHFEPDSTDSFYASIDFGTDHPTAILQIAVNEDGVVYVFDELYERDYYLTDMAEYLKKAKTKYPFKYIIRDSAARREGLELKKLGINTIPSDKRTTGINQTSNRNTGILKVNELFKNGELFISDRCVNLINELENHYYKEKSIKQEVNKVKDDAIDALRYFIFLYKVQGVTTEAERNYKKKHGVTPKSYLKNNLGYKPY